MSLFFRKQPDPKPLPPWLKAAIIAFVLYSVFLSVTAKPPTTLQENQALQAIDWSKQFNWEEYKAKVFPDMSSPLRIGDSVAGEGAVASCGQDVTIRYRAFLPDEKQIDGNADAEKPLTFTLGAGKIVPALEKGVVGMKVGGKRTITAADHMAYGADGFKQDHPDLAPYMIRFEIELLAVAPELSLPSSDSHMGLRTFDYTLNSSTVLGCGDVARIRLSVWKSDGTRIYSNMDEKSEPLTLRLGASQAPLGLEQGLIGLSPDHRRTLILPPYLLKRLREQPLEGSHIPPQISLPEGETLVMDVAFVSPTLPKKE